MRSDEMQVGKKYEISSSRATPQKVTVLETPSAIRRQAKVRIRFETGTKRGQSSEVMSRRILRPWGGERPVRKKKAQKTGRLPLEMDWPPSPGDQVRWSETADIRWTVETIDKGIVTLSGHLFTRQQTQKARLKDLRPALAPEETPARQFPRIQPKPKSQPAARPRLLKESVKQDDPLEAILNDVIFSESCLRYYQRKFAKGTPWQKVSSRLRTELREQGTLIRPRKSRGYIHIRVEGRFDAVVEESPSVGGPPIVNGLDLPASRRRSKKGSQRNAA